MNSFSRLSSVVFDFVFFFIYSLHLFFKFFQNTLFRWWIFVFYFIFWNLIPENVFFSFFLCMCVPNESWYVNFSNFLLTNHTHHLYSYSSFSPLCPSFINFDQFDKNYGIWCLLNLKKMLISLKWIEEDGPSTDWLTICPFFFFSSGSIKFCFRGKIMNCTCNLCVWSHVHVWQTGNVWPLFIRSENFYCFQMDKIEWNPNVTMFNFNSNQML